MITRTVKSVVFLVGLSVLVYGYFLVPLGELTLFQHTMRIAGTDEAQHLGEELGVASEELESDVRGRLEAMQAADAGEAADGP